MSNVPHIGHPTDKEKQFTNYMLDCIADYVEKIPTNRGALIFALSRLAQIVFCQETSCDVKKQCEEINDFCQFLKSYALKNAKRN